MNITEIFNLAIQNHKKNKLEEAQNFYDQVLKINSEHSEAINNLGVIFLNSKKYQKALDYFKKAIKINPNYVDAHYNLGITLKTLGENRKAIASFEKTIELKPDNLDAQNNLGDAYFTIGEYNRSVGFYEKVIKINPKDAKTLNILGTLFILLENYQKAKKYLKEALRLNPNSSRVLQDISRIYILQLNNFDKAIGSSYEALKVYHKNSTFINQNIPLFRLKHDVQQAEYLISKNYKLEGIKDFKKIGSEILDRAENKEDENSYNKKILLTPVEISALLPFYKSDHVYKPKKISGSCINLNKNWSDVEDEYLNSTNQILYIDDFLSEEALIELREFCLVSKVWNTEYYNPFLGATSTNGFISPIHLQIAIELQKKLPKLFGLHKLSQFWGFKYDSTLGKGINVHADFAIHNLNFWITPDEYNNNKNSGGLKVYDVPAPDHWTFKDYNMDTIKIYNFLKDNSANCVNIPYKFNRAVLFNSAYFHETDEIDFKDEYVGRRVNNTYLFGKRLVKNYSGK
jgi:tetratricopeptide (TPR) repeat protein